MARSDRPILLGWVSAAAGVGALVTPFVGGVSPLNGMGFGLRGEGIFLFAVSAAALLAVPIAVWQVRRTWVPVPGKLERALAYLFSSAAMSPVLIASAFTFTAPDPGASLMSILALAVAWCAVAGNLLVSYRSRVGGKPPAIRAEVFLLLGYLPNALYALIVFSYASLFSFGPSWLWDRGAYLVLVTCVLYTVQVVLLLRDP